MKLSFRVKEKPSSDRSTLDWFHVKKTSSGVPFKFKEGHPKSFHPIDFAIWAAFNPTKAREHFSSILIDAFEYSWTSLIEKVQEKPDCHLKEFAECIEDYPWLYQEFSLWGGIFSSLWVMSEHLSEPLIYKIISRNQRDWQINRRWICEDGITPKTYTFVELALNKRDVFILDEEIDYLENEELKNINVGSSNLGVQFQEDSSSLTLLPEKWGFDEKGGITYIGKK